MDQLFCYSWYPQDRAVEECTERQCHDTAVALMMDGYAMFTINLAIGQQLQLACREWFPVNISKCKTDEIAACRFKDATLVVVS